MSLPLLWERGTVPLSHFKAPGDAPEAVNSYSYLTAAFNAADQAEYKVTLPDAFLWVRMRMQYVFLEASHVMILFTVAGFVMFSVLFPLLKPLFVEYWS